MEETTFFNRYWDFALEFTIGPTPSGQKLAARRSAAKGRKRNCDLDPSTERKTAPIDPCSPSRGFFPEATPKPVRDSVAPDMEDAIMLDTTGPSVNSPTNKPVGEFAYWFDNDGSDSKKAAIWTKYLSEELKAHEVKQMNLTGLPRSNAQFLCATINYEWDGDTSEGGSIEKCFTEEMVSVLSMAMDNAEGDLVILPASKLGVPDKKLWLTSKEKVEELTYKKLRPYIDWSWNNRARFGYNAKNPGSKTLCTRICVAHNSSLVDMARLLGQCFEITGTHAAS
ncbi:unnamed protein product [Cylindrotheca closterium]|uniref:Uncharacterized protein n=1 Tax=Cylindrotheca closterium TaxID=2856 RepID=A0AAD2JIM8_9STRA|nr:unnamed protein product [Cylindrotheca closterium]